MKDFIDIIKERVRSPLLGAFSFFFALINWEIIAILFFSNKEIEKRIIEVNSRLGDINHALFLPALASLLYIFALPIINVAINTYFHTITEIGRRRSINISQVTEIQKTRSESQLSKIKHEEEVLIERRRLELEVEHLQMLSDKLDLAQIWVEKSETAKDIDRTIEKQKETATQAYKMLSNSAHELRTILGPAEQACVRRLLIQLGNDDFLK